MSSDEIQKQIYKEVIDRKQDFLNKMDELNNSGIQNILEQDKKYLLICKDDKITKIFNDPIINKNLSIKDIKIFYIKIVTNLYLNRVVQPTCNKFINYPEAISKFKERLIHSKNKTYYLGLSESPFSEDFIIYRDDYYVISSFLKAGEVKEEIDHYPYTLPTFFTEIDKTLKDMSDFDIMRNLWVVNEKINKINKITWVDNEKINRITDPEGGKPKLFRLYNLTGKRKSRKSRKSKKSRKSRKTRKSKKK